MTWVHRQPRQDVHRCDWPVREVVYRFPSMVAKGGTVQEHRETVPDGQRGDLWRCLDCRALWRIEMGCDGCTWNGRCRGHYVGLILRLVWMPARPWQRLRYRKLPSELASDQL